MKKPLKTQPTPLQKANNQVHILQTTVTELNTQLAASKIALERRDRMLVEQIERADRLDKGLAQVRIELAGIKSKWYYSLFKNW